VAQLARQNPQRMYEKLGRVAGQHQDICVLDVFLRGGSAGEELAAAGGAMPVVVLEREEEARK